MIANVTLPGGLWIDGDRHQSADLRAMTGADEEFLRSFDSAVPLARQVTGLLERCVSRIGPLSPAHCDVLGELTVGDREALLLHLRRLTFGHRMQCVLDCPQCDQRLDLDLSVDQLLVAPYADARPWYETVVTDEVATCKVRYRLPRGSDQEAVADLAKSAPSQAASEVLRRCIEPPDDDSSREIDRMVAKHVASRLPGHDPQAELRLVFDCAGCKRQVSALLDAASFLFRDLAMRTGDLYREIHTLAMHYHWSEQEILAMTVPRRQRYLNLIAESLSRRGA